MTGILPGAAGGASAGPHDGGRTGAREPLASGEYARLASPSASGSYPAPGRTLGRYRVARRLGSGGFARVYRAWDPELELDVAIKLLRPEFAADPETVERFRREASTVARLRHPNIVTVLTVGRLEEPFDGAAPGAPYLVMDYLPGSLALRLAESPALDEAETARIGREIALGLAFAHRAGIVHRDVKPENVLFAPDGRAVVTDFGIARAISSSVAVAASRNVVLGTPSYFSPEQARGLAVDGRSDVYALGVLLYRVATGILPFEGEDWYDVMRRHVEEAPEPPRAIVPGLSAAFEALVLRCLAKAPADRYATADQLADALAPLARGDALTVEVSPFASDADAAATRAGGRANGSRGGAPPARPRRRAAAILGASLLLAAATGGLLWSRHGSAGLQTRARLAPPAESLPPAPAVGPPAVESLAVARPESVPAAPPPRVGTLTVTAPGADLTIDGRRVARGSWSDDSVRPGRHVIIAQVPSISGCPTADTTAIVDVAAGAQRTVRLRATPCGRLTLDVEPSRARYTLAPREGGAQRQGSLPLVRPLVLPEGEYRLTVEAPYCAPFSDDVRLTAGGAVQRSERIRLICN